MDRGYCAVAGWMLTSPGLGVADMSDIIPRVEEDASLLVDEARAMARNDEQRVCIRVRYRLSRAEIASALCKQRMLVEAARDDVELLLPAAREPLTRYYRHGGTRQR